MDDDELILMHIVDREPKDIYEAWPLHVTVMPWFKGYADHRSAVASLDPIFRQTDSFLFEKGEYRQFGRDKSISVDLVEPPGDFRALHRKILDTFHDLDITVLSARFCGDDYLPHVTRKRGRQLLPGKSYCAEHVSMYQGSSIHTHRPKKLVKTWRLGGKNAD